MTLTALTGAIARGLRASLRFDAARSAIVFDTRVLDASVVPDEAAVRASEQARVAILREQQKALETQASALQQLAARGESAAYDVRRS